VTSLSEGKVDLVALGEAAAAPAREHAGLRRLGRVRWGLAAAVVLLLIVASAIFAPLIAPHDPLAVNIRHNRMVISLPGDVLFDSGRDTLKKDGQAILQKVAAVIKADEQLKKRDYQVAGHTDNKALNGGPLHDNWGLSLMRAREVLLFLVGDKGGQLPIAHWSAAGFADTDPVASNDTDDGRQKNRRCDLIVVPSVEEMLDLKAITQ